MKLKDQTRNWFEFAGVEELPSPCLLIYPERVEANLKRMLQVAGNPEKLRPHTKTHKIRDLLELQLAMGITKFKCATIAEAELAATTGAHDVLLAYQPVGPAIWRVAELCARFSQVRFSVVADDPRVLQELSQAVGTIGGKTEVNSHSPLEVLVDLDIGMHRTGIAPGAAAFELYRLIGTTPGVKPGGLHAYDGHLSQAEPALRESACEQAFVPVAELRNQLEKAGFKVPRVVAGGTPTFPFHAGRQDVECSPGTCLLWDAGYGHKFQDLGFRPAALVLTRVVSKPGANRLCLDLGHKAIASEMPHPRVIFLNLEDAQAVTHSEEHLLVETHRSAEFEIGDYLYGLPWHICPTVALHSEAVVIREGKISGTWKVAARDRRLTI